MIEKVTGKGAVRSFPIYRMTKRALDVLEKRRRSTGNKDRANFPGIDYSLPYA